MAILAAMDAGGKAFGIVGDGDYADLIASAFGGAARWTTIGLAENVDAVFLCGKSIDEARREGMEHQGPDIIWVGWVSPDAALELQRVARLGRRRLLILVLALTASGDLMAISSGDADLQRMAEPVTRTFAAQSFFLGPDIQAASAAEALNAMLAAAARAMTAEAAFLAERLGIDRETLFDALNQSTGGSGATQKSIPTSALFRLFSDSSSADHYLAVAKYYAIGAPLAFALAREGDARLAAADQAHPKSEFREA